VEAIYHQQVLERAIGGRVSRQALAAITAANLAQDSLRGLLHPVYHFDDSLFAEGLAYIEEMRAAAVAATATQPAWQAFGRLSHAAQDFYSHSNFVALWLERFAPDQWPPPSMIDGLDASLLQHPRLISGRIYLPLEALCLLRPLRPLVKRLLPRDSHAWMNLDGPETGPVFPYSLEAAIRRTRAEFERTLAAIGQAAGEAGIAAFLDQPTP
jgi:hypothetical protein